MYTRRRGQRRTIIRKADAVSLGGVFSFCSCGNLCFMHRESSHRQFPRYCSIWREVFQHRKYLDVLKCCSKMFFLKDENTYLREAQLIIEICLCAPVSNASLERLFSQMNIINSDVRNRLSNKALIALLRIRTPGITIDDFHNDHVYKCVIFWYNKKKRRQTKTKENAKIQKKPSESFLLYKDDLKLPNIKCLFSVCL